MAIKYQTLLVLLVLSWSSPGQQKRFELLSSSRTGVNFTNWITSTDKMNVFLYPYFYNGGGVAVGDINNDGLQDIFFVANYGPDKLYLNKGNMVFEDITPTSGVRGTRGWETGVTMCDINNDGWIDIYVCRSGIAPKTPSSNLLYVNNKNNTFTEKSMEYGLGDIAHTTQASFIDYDSDGDLDLFLLDHSIERMNPQNISYTYRDLFAGDKLFKNDNGKFVEVTEQVGLIGTKISYGLGVMIGDLNRDGNPDIYVSNEYVENDYLYSNNGNGTFSDVGMMAGVSYSDWSWGALLADFDNDGWKDQYISNGYRVNLSKDYLDWYKSREMELQKKEFHERDFVAEIQEALEKVTSEKVINYMFKNARNLNFENMTEIWGLADPSFSNGFAYGDLDNDGDLDLVVNNLDQEAFIYENKTNSETNSHYLGLKFLGPKENKLGIGTKVELKHGTNKQFQEFYITRGFQSSVAPIMHFGLGESIKIDKIKVTWYDGKEEISENIKADQVISVDYNNAKKKIADINSSEQLFEDITRQSGINYVHVENSYNDFEKQILLPHKMSQFGPALAVADVNGDGLEDFFVGGAKGRAGALYFQDEDGKFRPSTNNPWQMDKQSEDLDALFFDADLDGDQDLYIVSGGNEYKVNDTLFQDRLYMNNGIGEFTHSDRALPRMFTSGGVVKAGDLDSDGDLDLFVGGRLVPGQYPQPPRSYILENNHGIFTDITSNVAPSLGKPGMITDAAWTDFNGDNQLDLIVVGEWMPILMFENKGGKLEKVSIRSELNEHTGWWFSVAAADMDHDGDVDFVVGNLGNNYKYKASKNEPFKIYAKDFDQNGHLDIVLGYYNDNELYPVRGLQCSSEQIPDIKKKFHNYNAFAGATLMEIYEEMTINYLLL